MTVSVFALMPFSALAVELVSPLASCFLSVNEPDTRKPNPGTL